MAKFETVHEDARVSKMYGTLPAFDFQKVVSLDGTTDQERFADLLSLFGGDLATVLSAAISAYNTEARSKASGSTDRQIAKGLRDALKAGAFPGHDEKDTAFLSMLVASVKAQASASTK